MTPKNWKKLLFVCSLFFVGQNVSAQYYSYYNTQPYKKSKGARHDDMEFIIHAGATYSDLRYGTSVAANLGIDYTPYEADGSFSYSFNTNAAYCKDYWSVSPLGASAIVLSLFCKNIVEDDPTVHTMLMIMAGESMSLNFALNDHIEVAPCWNLLRLSSWQKGATYVTGTAGLKLNVYFGPEDRWSLRAHGEYSWGYGNGDWWGEKIYNIFGDSGESTYYEEYKKPKTPFKGWQCGLSLGYRL